MKPPSDSSMRGFPTPSGGKLWPSTNWEMVRKARDGGGPEKKAALDQLLLTYYKPVYRFFQRVLDAHGERLKDVTQEFFARFVEKEFLKNLSQEKSFRGFLKVACRRHYINFYEAERARRPSDGRRIQGLIDADGRPIDVPIDEEMFTSMIDEELRASYLEQAMQRVKDRLVARDKDVYLKVFEARMRFDGQKPTDYETLARQVNRSVFDVRNYLTAVRKLFRESLVDLAAERSDDPKRELRELGLLKLLS